MRIEALRWVLHFSLQTCAWGMWVVINPSGLKKKKLIARLAFLFKDILDSKEEK